ncbi:NUDIX hydrolase [Streptomyces sp. HC307]|uniref:NUDIX hydrolase n=1 Tax=Streptomyces flavusporus TaxID=3385496 RepID=UPI00391744D6
MSDDNQSRGPLRDASVVVARDSDDRVAILSADFPRHGGEHLFLPGGRREDGETPEQCARRELREEAGVTADVWRSLGSYAITLDSAARVHLYEATSLTCGPQELTPSEEGFKLMWMAAADALDAVAQGRFLLPAGPLALLLAERGGAAPQRSSPAGTVRA